MKTNQKGGIKILVAILIILILIAGALFAIKILNDNKEQQTGNNTTEEEKQTPKPQPKTLAGNERAIAYVLDNNSNAVPQAGLEEADIVYEMIVEGGETRLMAIMKNKNVEKIGPIRSARHYFLDYALENDAIYVHFGQSPQAADDITTLGITDINGIYYDGTTFWRVKDRYSPHNAVTSTANIKKIIEQKDYRDTTNKENVLNYVVDEVDLSAKKEENNENTQGTTNTTDTATTNSTDVATKNTNNANTVTIPYSYYNTVKYEYDEESKTYIRYSKNKKQTDWNTGEAIKVKNIIITKCENSTLNDGTDKGRQTLANVATLDGYYITNGNYIPIKCEKTTRSGQTVYKDLDGKEINVNDGKTFIQICPLSSKISFE